MAVLLMAAAAGLARADAVQTLRDFVREVTSGRASFTQTVVSTDGVRQRVSRGEFEFARPNRFRFHYSRPFEQLIVADGEKVWVYDPDLNQASSRRLGQALGATPAALLAGAALEPDFVLSPLPSAGGLDWVLAMPQVRDGPFQSMRVAFRGKVLALVEVTDSFGQLSRLEFRDFAANPAIEPARFRFEPPAGADVIEQ